MTNEPAILKNWEDPIDPKNVADYVRVNISKRFNETDQKQEIIEILKALDGIKRKLQKLVTNTTG